MIRIDSIAVSRGILALALLAWTVEATLAVAMAVAGNPVAQAQKPLSKADSGWVSIFNGKDFTGLYIRLGGALQNPATQTSFTCRSAARAR